MADIESNIRIGVDTSDAMASIKALQAQISAFQRQMASSSAANADSARKLRRGLVDDLNATGQWSASIKNIKSTSESFTNALEKNKLSMGEYFRFAGASTQKFGRLFTTEFNTIEKVARERVKDLQTQYISLGRDANGALKSIAVRPLKLDMNDLATQTAMTAQKQQIFNQLLKQGSTNLLNFGKNTQWAGRQLMVGFTIPLSIFGGMASKTFMELEEQAIRFKRVYGELFTPPEEADEMLETLRELGKEFTKYGVAVEKTLGLAADAAAMGKTGVELLDQVSEATRLAVLGSVDQQKALETTISLTNAFGTSTEDLAKKIDFLNAVENQTVVSIEDLTTAIPKAGPVVKQLGGDVEELAFFLTAMKEGGINASEGANALKSGLASLINPTGVANTMLKTFGINIKEITAQNRGDVKGLVIDFAEALDVLDPSQRAQVIEQLFGKFQFARISTLFKNVIEEGNQASRVLELTNATTAELADLSAKELRRVEESTTFRFRKAIEEFQVAIAPIGEQFLKLITPIIEFATKIIEKFNDLSDGAKSFITGLTVLLGAVGPVALMTFGLLANGVANIIKGFVFVRDVFLKTGKQSTILGEQIDYMTNEQLNAAAVAASLDQTHQQLIQTFSVEAGAVKNLADVYRQAFNEQQRFDTGRSLARQAGMRLASGIVSVPGPKGAGDIVPAMLTPGEAVIPAGMAKKYAPLIQGMIADNIPGFNKGVFLGMPRSGKSTGKNRDAAQQIYEMFLQSSYKNVPPTEYGHQIAPTSGHSFPIFGLGGVYMSPAGEEVFVKPVMDEKAALAEMRGTQIARQVHGLKAPEQRIVVMRDPQDPKRERRFLALESKLDSTFINNDPMAVFNEDQYFKQLVASLLRVDKDLSAGNVFKDVVADVGPAGVFSRASGIRDYADSLPSMEDQAMVNLLGIKGGAKRAFAESTLALMSGLTPEQYHQKMIGEIQQVLPLLKQTVAGFGLTDPREAKAYSDMISRLEQGLTVDWSKFHAIHSAVKPAKPKQTDNPVKVPGYADGVVSVPGPKGKGDVVPAMLSPGEAVIPTKMAKKYAPLINAMISGNIPGYELGKLSEAGRAKYQQEIQLFPEIGAAIDAASEQIGSAGDKTQTALMELEKAITPIIKLARSTIAYNEPKGASARSNSGANLSHLVPYMMMSPDQANRAGQELLGAGTNTAPARYMASTERPVKAVSNLVASLPRPANDPSGTFTAEETARWIQEEKTRFTSFIYENYAKAKGVDPNDPELMRFAEKIANELQQAGAQAIDDPKLYSIVKEAMADMLTGAAKDAVIQAASEFSTIEMPGSDGKTIRRTAIGGKKALTPLGAQTPFADGQGFVSESVGLVDAQARSYRGYGRTAAGRPVIAQQDLQADESVIKALKDRASNIIKNGLSGRATSTEIEQMSNSAAEGIRKGQDDASIAGEQLAEKTVAGIYRVGARRVTTNPDAFAAATAGQEPQSARNRGPRRATRMGDLEARQLAEAAAATQNATAETKKLTKTTQSSTDKLAKMNSALMNGTFALTSLAGVGMMMDGTIGEASQAIFQYSGVIFGLMQITQLLTQAKIAELAATRLGVAKAAMARQIVLARKAGEVVGPLSLLRTGFTALLGPIGLVVLGLTTIAGGIALFLKIQEDQKQKVEGLGNAAFLTAEKMKKAGDILGFEAKTSSFAETANAGSASGRSTEEVSLISQLRESDDFKKTFKSDIDAIRNATSDQAQAALESVSNQLFASGASQEQVDAYVRAIAQEAGKTDLSFSFAKVDFATEGAQRIVQFAEQSSSTYANVFSKNVKVLFDKQGNIVPEMTQYGQEGLQAVNTFAGNIASSFQSLKDGLANGLISADQFQEALGGLSDNLNELDDAELLVALPNIYEKLGIEQLMSAIPLVKDQLVLLKAFTSGIMVSPEELAALENANKKDIDAQRLANRVRDNLLGKLSTEVNLREETAKKAEEQRLIDEAIGAANTQLADRIVQLENQRIAYDALIAAGYDAETAFDLAGDAGLAAGIKAAAGAGIGSTEWKNVIDLINQLNAAEENAPKAPTSGGTAEKSPLQQATDQLKEQRKEIIESANAYSKLRNAGFEVRDAMVAAEDPILAAALATTKVGTKAWTNLVNKIKEVNNLLNKKELQELLKTGKIDIQDRKNQTIVSSALDALGWSFDNIQEVLSDQEFTNTLAKDLKDGSINSRELLNRLSQIKQLENLEVELNFTTKEGAADEFQKRYDKVVGSLEAKKQVIEIDFKVRTQADEQIAKDAENQIAALQFEMDDYEAGLTRLEKDEKAINDEYDRRKEALDKISKINQDIAAQQKGQLDLASALSQGDIVAAARAAQELRAKARESAEKAAQDRLEISRERRLKGLSTQVNGNVLSREDLEQKIADIKEKIFNIEEDTLEPARERIRLAGVEKDAATASLDAQILRWDQLSARVNAAKLSLTPEEISAMEYQAGLIADLLENWNNIEDKTATLTIIKKTLDGSSSTAPASTSTPKTTTPSTSSSSAPSTSSSKPAGPAPATQVKPLIPTGGSLVGNITIAPITAAEKESAKPKTATSNAVTVAAKIAADKITKPIVAAANKQVEEAKAKDMSGNAKKAIITSAGADKAMANRLNNVIANNVAKSISTTKSVGAGKSIFAMSAGGTVPRYMRMGGLLPYKAEGGQIFKPLGTDKVPAMLTPGEFVVSRPAVQTYGVDKLRAINSGTYNGDSVYNYNLNVNVKSDANPNEIAQTVMTRIKQVDSMRLRGNRF